MVLKLKKSFLYEIQGLRAIAVLLVLIYHIQPSLIPGGYIGVDIFFVISGFIITKLLFEETQQHNSIQLGRFFSRRIFRLLPSALLVMLFVALIIPLVPKTNWDSTASQLVASAFYVQNWYMAASAADYLGGDVNASPLKHFWTLSVEEQFYIVWPLLMWLGITLALRAKKSPFVFITSITLGLLFCSAAYSYWYTHYNGASAYFSTFTRAWQFLLGAICAIVLVQKQLRLHRYMAQACTLIGALLIAYAAFAFNKETVFPGIAAWVPSLGAALILVAVAATRSAPSLGAASLLLANPASVFIGRISYALYLWHWPLIFVAFSLLELDVTLLTGTVILVLSIVMAWLVTFYVEEPIRAWGTHKNRAKGLVFSVPLASFSVILLVSFSVLASLQKNPVLIRDNTTIADMLPDFDITIDIEKLLPHPTTAKLDNPDAYRLQCHQARSHKEPKWCDYGHEGARKLIVLAGDSHAASFMHALEAVVKNNSNYRLRVVTKSACSLTAALTQQGRRKYHECETWNKKLLPQILSWKPDYVVTTQSQGARAYNTTTTEESNKALTNGLIEVWKKLKNNGAKVIAISDTPSHHTDIPLCLTKPDATLDACATKRDKALRNPQVITNAAKEADAYLLDLNDIFCDDEWCYPNRGNRLMWRDNHHLTKSFSSLLGNRFYAALDITKEAITTPITHKENIKIFSGDLICSGLNGGRKVSLPRSIQLVGDQASLHRGDYQSLYKLISQQKIIPKQLEKSGIEIWLGAKKDEKISIIGWYSEGSTTTKWISFSGTITEKNIKLKGKRGPRSCEFNAKFLRETGN